MAKHDIKYSLVGKGLDKFMQGLNTFNRDDQDKVLQQFIKEITTNKAQLFSKNNHYDDLFNKFLSRIAGGTFWKSLKECDHVCTQYPNLIGEIFEYKNSKGWRQQQGQFFTPQQVADTLQDFIYEPVDSICDPCAGVGALLLGKNLLKEGGKAYANDIEWVRYWYNLNALYHGKEFYLYDNSIVDLMVLNPPFDQQDCIEFLTLASEKANQLLLIVPTSFDENNRTYKKAFALFEEHFIIQNTKFLDKDVFAWYGTQINTKVLLCKNIVQREREIEIKIENKEEEYQIRYKKEQWETMPLYGLKKELVLINEDLEIKYNEAMKNKVNNKEVFINKINAAEEVALDKAALLNLIQSQKTKQALIFKETGTLFG